MSDQDIFNKETDKDLITPPIVDPIIAKVIDKKEPTESYNQMLGMIVNTEGEQKYSNIEEALKGAAHAQSYIAKLETELAEAKTSGATTSKLEDILSAVKTQTTPGDPLQKTTPDEVTKPQDVDIEKVVQDTLDRISTKSIQENNIKLVTGKLKELYNEKASEILYGKAEDLGLSRTEMNGLIENNPKAVFKLLGVDTEAVTTSVNTDKTVITTDLNYKPKTGEVPSSMGYITSEQSIANWKASIEKTNERLKI